MDPLFDEDSSEYGRPETGRWAEPEATDLCEICGEPYDPARPNAGDGWAEMANPEHPDGLSFTCHFQCGQAEGLELA